MYRLAIPVTALIIGAVSMLTQLGIIRELSLVFTGNELFLGLSLAGWMGGTALGAGWLFPRLPVRLRTPDNFTLAGYALLNSLMLPTAILLCRSTRLWLGVPAGLDLSFGHMLIVTVITTLPAAAAGGLWYAGLLTKTNKERDYIRPPGYTAVNRAGYLFGFETLGACLAGLAFTFWLAFYWNPWTISAGIFFATGLYVLSLQVPLGEKKIWLSLAILMLLLFSNPWAPLDRISSGWRQAPGRQLLSEYTARGHAALYEDQGLFSAYYSGKWVFSFPDPDSSEAPALLPFLISPKHRQIALFGGGPEILQLLLDQPEVEQITIFNEDPQALSAWQAAFPKSWKSLYFDPRVKCQLGDGRMLLKQDPALYDIIILATPPPDNLSMNRFYTLEFMRLLRSRLAPDGILEYYLPYSPNSINTRESALLGSLWHTLKTSFPHVLLMSGNQLYFLASPNSDLSALTPEVLASRLKHLPLKTSALTMEHLPLLFDSRRIKKIRAILDSTRGLINTDQHPLAAGFQSLFWLSRHTGPATMGAGILLSILVIVLIRAIMARRIKPDFLIMGTAGGAGICLELFVITAFQSSRGDLWQEIGLLFGAFMAGLALGGFAAGKVKSPRHWRRLTAISLASVCILAYFLVYKTQGNLLVTLGILLAGGMGVGGLYGIICLGGDSRKAASAWAADLAGSLGGALLANTLLLPLLGKYAGLAPAVLLILTALPAGKALEKTAR